MPYYYPILGDPTFILVLFALLLTVAAQLSVKSTFKKYSSVESSRGLRAEDAARIVLQNGGADEVTIRRTSGNLTDNFNPKDNTINLSDSVYGSSSIAAIGVACHEAGHAVQHAKGYIPLKLRHAVLPVCSIGSSLAVPIAIVGVILHLLELIQAGVFLYGLLVVFQLITLPVEFNASRRALNAVADSQILDEKEQRGARKVLAAAAMTYVAAMAASLINLFRFALIFLSGRRRG